MTIFGSQPTAKVKLRGDILPGNNWQICGVPLFSSHHNQVLKVIGDWLVEFKSGSLKQPKWIATVNPEFIMQAISDKNFLETLNRTDLNVIDGIGLIWARELEKRLPMTVYGNVVVRIYLGFLVGWEIIIGKHKEGLVSGSDLIVELSKMAAEKGQNVFFLGGWEDRAKRTAQNFQSLITNFKSSWSPGEPEVSNKEVLKKINEYKPDVLFVAYGMKKQEEWIRDNIDKLKAGVVIGVGRSFDYYSGDLKRAPKIWRKMGLEWLYSLIREPQRWRRQIVLPKFVWKVLMSD